MDGPCWHVKNQGEEAERQPHSAGGLEAAIGLPSITAKVHILPIGYTRGFQDSYDPFEGLVRVSRQEFGKHMLWKFELPSMASQKRGQKDQGIIEQLYS